MITIQGFSRLCGCNTQTLRYYDRIGLLKPAKVDEWTGYRYYEEEQAMLFVRIKNLQQADFSIEEIKALLPGDDDHLMAAFERKIEQQKQKLEKIREIQRSYLEEAMDMRKMVNEYMDFVERRMARPELWKELGLDAEQEAEITANVHALLADWISQCRKMGDESSLAADGQQRSGMENIISRLKSSLLDGAEELLLSRDSSEVEKDIPADAEKVFERSGWEHVSEWIGEVPNLGNGKQKYFVFRVQKDSPVADAGFPTILLGVMAARYDAMNGGMTCMVSRSSDGINHFILLQK